MVFDYSAEKTFLQSIDVVDPGNTALRCVSSDGLEYYIIIKTIMGQMNFIEFGPTADGVSAFFETFKLEYKSAKYNEKKLSKEITLYINDGLKHISEVEEILPEVAMKALPDLTYCWENV